MGPCESSAVEHILKTAHLRDVPIAKGLVEACRAMEHVAHIGDASGVPLIKVLIELSHAIGRSHDALKRITIGYESNIYI